MTDLVALATEFPATALQALENAYFRWAAVSGWAILALQVIAVASAAFARSDLTANWWQPVALAGIAIATAAFTFAGDHAMARADALKRRREFLDGLGRLLTARELADYLDDASLLVRALAKRLVPQDPYYASGLSPSPQRSIHNTYESAWWTLRLAKDMVFAESVRGFLLAAVAALLLRSTTIPMSFASQSDLVRVAAVVLLFVLTKGPVRQAFAFASLRDGAGRIARRCEDLLATSPTELDAVELLLEYQMVRKGSPLIPSLLWRLRRRTLNRLWLTVERRMPAGHSG